MGLELKQRKRKEKRMIKAKGKYIKSNTSQFGANKGHIINKKCQEIRLFYKKTSSFDA